MNRAPYRVDRLWHSLRGRMTFGITAGFAVIAIMICIGFYQWSCLAALRDAQERVRAAVRLVTLEWNGERTPARIGQAFGEAREDMRLDRISILMVDPSGEVLGQNRTPHLPWPSPESQGWITEQTSKSGTYIAAGMKVSVVDAVSNRQTILLALAMLMATVAVGIVTWTLVGRTLHPIAELADQATQASANPLEAQLRASSEDSEVRYLVITLNGFLTRLQESTRAREQFYVSAAHELRTPLTILSGSLEVAASRPRSAAEYRETINDLQQETRRLVALVEGMLTLNRLEMHTDGEEKAMIDLVDSCHRALAPLAGRIEERALQVELALTDSPSAICAPPSHVGMLMRNLLENAVKYTPRSGTIRVVLDSDQDQVTLRVENDCADVAQLPYDRLCEPFFRAQTTTGITTEGNGLGLAICRRVADTNGWSLKLSPSGQGVVAQVTFS